jgi:hypothetical protein
MVAKNEESYKNFNLNSQSAGRAFNKRLPKYRTVIFGNSSMKELNLTVFK